MDLHDIRKIWNLDGSGETEEAAIILKAGISKG